MKQSCKPANIKSAREFFSPFFCNNISLRRKSYPENIILLPFSLRWSFSPSVWPYTSPTKWSRRGRWWCGPQEISELKSTCSSSFLPMNIHCTPWNIHYFSYALSIIIERYKGSIWNVWVENSTISAHLVVRSAGVIQNNFLRCSVFYFCCDWLYLC